MSEKVIVEELGLKDKGLFLRLSPHNNYDDFYTRLDERNKTWREILYCIEDALESQYLNNDDSLVGIKLEIEIVDRLPEDCEIIGDLEREIDEAFSNLDRKNKEQV